MKTFWRWHYAGLEPLNKTERGLETSANESTSFFGDAPLPPGQG